MPRLKEIAESACVVMALLVLGALNVGWPFYPILGVVNGWLNAGIVGGIVLVGVWCRAVRKARHHDDDAAV
jgi:hypothetical protein